MNLAASSLLRFVPPALSGSAHAALIAALIVISPLPQQDSAGAGITVFEVSMVEEGEASASPASAEAAPQEPQQEASSQVAPPTPPEVAPAVAEPLPPPEMAAPEAMAVPPPKAKPVARLRVPPAPKVMAERPRPKAAPREATPRRDPASSGRRAHGGTGQLREGASAGRGGGAAPGSNLSGAAYAGKVRAILQARANALGIEDQDGAVGLSFVIGASGRIERHAITRTSGSAQVDRMIRGIMASSGFPPPPGGRFSGSVTIRIQ